MTNRLACTQVEARDRDSGDNGRIAYSIIGEAESWFRISENGTLFSTRQLDREIRAAFSFVVKATDGNSLESYSNGGGGGSSGGGRNSATATVLLTIQDVNDESPVFTSPSDAFVAENLPPNTVVMSVTTVDRDQGRNADIEYFLTRSDSDNFDIGRLDGILRTTRSLDREEKASYDVVVTATDNGSPRRRSASMDIRVHVLDANDNTPVFRPKTYSATVLENATLGQNILDTTAFDADSGLNGEIRWDKVKIVRPRK
jgi:hypothetical protein